MGLRPTVIVQLQSRAHVEAIRAGAGPGRGVIALGIDTGAFWTLAGIDALYVGLSGAEQWGSHPLPPHTAALLRTTTADRDRGLPPFIVTGLVLGEGEPDTAEFVVPILVGAVRRVIDEANAAMPGCIRTIGFFEHQLTWAGVSLAEVGRLLALGMEAP